jgi:uncharacterized protein with beta-barrel porin domain
MERARISKLFSGVSAVALVAAMAAMSPNMARAADDCDQSGSTTICDGGAFFSGPNYNPFESIGDNYINIFDSAVIEADINGVSITASGLGNFFDGKAALGIYDSVVEGDINLHGVLDDRTIEIEDSLIEGALNNFGVVSDGSYSGSGGSSADVGALAANGLTILNSTIGGGINNAGVYSGTQIGVSIVNSTIGTTTEGIDNSNALMAGGNTGLLIDSSAINGNINNAGGMIAGGSTGIRIEPGSNVNGDILNNVGLIQGGHGIRIADSNVTGGIKNDNGTIQGFASEAIHILDSHIGGGITNGAQGIIASESSDAIHIEDSSIDNGINNSGTIFSGDGHGIFLDNSNLTSGIVNSGIIATDNGDAIRIEGNVLGGITNNVGGMISADGGTRGNAININSGTFGGGIVNSGHIGAEGTGDSSTLFAVIDIDNDAFSGGITNNATGVIAGDAAAINITSTVDNFSGGIVNAGTITAGDGDDGAVFAAVDINADNFSGGFDNKDGATITAAEGNGVEVDSETFTGDFKNGVGSTIAGTASGVEFDVDTFNGSFTNKGTISGGGEPPIILTTAAEGVSINASVMTGAFTNDGGTITSGSNGNGVQITLDGLLGGGFANSNGGTISGGNTGVEISANALVGGFTNGEGSSILGANGSGVFLFNGGTFLGINPMVTFDGDVNNAGTIGGANNGVAMFALNIDGAIVNSGAINAGDGYGVIVAGAAGIGGFGSATNLTGGIDNSGTILATVNGVEAHVTNFGGGFVNTGQILAGPGGSFSTGFSSASVGVNIVSTQFTGGFANGTPAQAGVPTIAGTGTGVFISNSGNFQGNVFNSGTIIGTENAGLALVGAPTAPGSYDRMATLDGNVTNEGDIFAGKVGLVVSADNITGAVTNSGDIQVGQGSFNFSLGGAGAQIFAGVAGGIIIDTQVLTGGFANTADGNIVSVGTGVEISAGLIGASVTNAGSISTTDGGGLVILAGQGFVSSIDGSVLNSGTINASSTRGGVFGIEVLADLITGDFKNTGTIHAGSIGMSFVRGNINGAFSNEGSIVAGLGTIVPPGIGPLNQAASAGMSFIGGVIAGGVNNSGPIYAPGDGIHVDADDVLLGVKNSSTIESTNADGIFVTLTGDLQGGFANNGAASSIIGEEFGVQIIADNLTGGFKNDGLIRGETSSGASVVLTGDFNGDFNNTAGASIFSMDDAPAVNLEAEDVFGNFLNAGTIRSFKNTGVALTLGGSFTGNFTNSGAASLIQGNQTAVNVDVDDWFGNFTNEGRILSALDNGVDLDVDGSYSGDFTNAAGALIDARGTGVNISLDGSGENFTGNFYNAGSIRSTDENGVRIEDFDNFRGNFTNALTGSIFSEEEAVNIVGNEDFVGDWTNAGSITSLFEEGVNIDFNEEIIGNWLNSGSISAEKVAVNIAAENMFGNWTNTGSITSDEDSGVLLRIDEQMVGDISNGPLASIEADGDAFSLNGTEFDGNFTNEGRIFSDNGTGAIIDVEVMEGDFTNKGVNSLIQGESTGALLLLEEFNGNFTNEGTIAGEDEYGVEIQITGGNWEGDFNSSGKITGDSTGVRINVDTGDWEGGFANSGEIDGDDEDGVQIDVAGRMEGGILNAESGSITGEQNGMHIALGGFDGDFTNDGGIEGENVDGVRLEIGSDWEEGNFTNTGSMIGDESGADIFVDGNWEGDFTNTGQVFGEDATGVRINVNGLWEGNFTNTPSLAAVLAGDIFGGKRGVQITADRIEGDFLNEGTIKGDDYKGVDIEADDGDIRGNFTNKGTIEGDDEGVEISASQQIFGDFTNTVDGVIKGGDDGVDITTNDGDLEGNFLNEGSIEGYDDGVDIEVDDDLRGWFTNKGTIEARNGFGANLEIGDSFFGDFTNEGDITSSRDQALRLRVDIYWEGNFLNSGLIEGDTDGARLSFDNMQGDVTNTGTMRTNDGQALDVDGDVDGTLFNGADGLLEALGSGATALEVDGNGFLGGIDNAGRMLALDGTGVDLSGAERGHTFTNRTLAQVRGSTAFDIDNNEDDRLYAEGGTFAGDIDADQSDDLIVNAAGGEVGYVAPAAASGAEYGFCLEDCTGEFLDGFDEETNFAYASGSATGLDVVDIESGVAAFGTELVTQDGEGVYVEANELSVDSGATLYLDDNTYFNLNFDANFESGATTVFRLTTDESTHGAIFAGGDVNIDGKFVADFGENGLLWILGNSQVEYFYDDLFAAGGSVNGTFDQVQLSDQSLFVDLLLDYNSDNVDLTVTRLGFGGVLGLTHNQTEVGTVLDEIFIAKFLAGELDDDLEKLFCKLLGFETLDELAAVYNELHGSNHAQIEQAALDVSNFWNQAVTARLDNARHSMDDIRYASNARMGTMLASLNYTTALSGVSASGAHGLARDGNGAAFWGRGIGAWGEVNGDAEAQGYDRNTLGFAGGVDFATDKSSLVGVAMLWSTTDVDFDRPGETADIDTWQIGAYGSWGLGGLYADLSANFAWNDIDSRRLVDIYDVVSDAAKAQYDQQIFTVAGELGTVFTAARTNIQPFIGLDYRNLSGDGFSESGVGSFDLVVDDLSADSLKTRLGVRASSKFEAGDMAIVPEARLEWQHQFMDDRQDFSATFSGYPGSTPLDIVGSTVSRDSAVIGLGLTAAVEDDWEIFGGWTGLINSDVNEQALEVTAKKNF